MGFNNYNPSVKLAGSLAPSGSGKFPLMQSCDIQIDEDGKRLDQLLSELVKRVNTSLPIEVDSEEAMNFILMHSTAANIGGVYEYTGPTTNTYKHGELYIIQEEST